MRFHQRDDYLTGLPGNRQVGRPRFLKIHSHSHFCEASFPRFLLKNSLFSRNALSNPPQKTEVEATGHDPATSGLQSRRSPN